MATFPPASRSPIIPEPTTSATRNVVPKNSEATRVSRGFISLMTNVFDSFLDRQFVQAGKWQGEKKTDSSIEHYECVTECSFDLLGRTFNCRGVRHSPVSGHRLPRPYRTDFFGCVITHSEDEMQFEAVEIRYFVPALTSQPHRWQAGESQLSQGLRMDTPFWMTSSAECFECGKSLSGHYGLSHDGTCRIART